MCAPASGLGVHYPDMETSCKGANCTSSEDITGEFAVAMDLDTLQNATHNGRLYAVRYISIPYHDWISRVCF